MAVELKIEIENIFAGSRVTGKADASARGASGISENHRLDGHRGANVIVDLIEAAVFSGLGRIPGAKDGFCRARELISGRLREGRPGHLLETSQHSPGELPQGAMVEHAFALLAFRGEYILNQRIERFGWQLLNDFGESLNQSPVAIPGEARIAG